MNKLDIINYLSGKSVEGYIWMSDSAYPICYDGFVLDCSLFQSVNPFPIEVMLLVKESNESFVARYVDGNYIVVRKHLCDMEYTDDIYWASFNKCITPNGEKIKFEKKIRMRQYWKEVLDIYCENMPVLQPAELVFVGFED